ncbi:MAG: serine/threonine-protein kinase [Thermoanaerobaculia bacterium]
MQTFGGMRVCPACHLCYEDSAERCAEDHPPLISIRPGTRLIAEKYRLGRLIGRGGIGSVYEALHVGLDRAVAVKLLRQDYLEDAEALERFRREGRAVARIRHPNVADIYDSGVLVSGEAYIAMELVSGETLRSFLDRCGRLPVGQAARIGRQVAEGIEAAHRSGVIHRDLKPSNVILATDHAGAPQVKILDFSIAKLDEPGGPGSEALTAAGAFLGTPHYMSPEQCEGNPLDERSDIYSLGVLLYEMLAGAPPFEGRSAAAVALKQVKDFPAPLQPIRADLPEELGWLVMQALHKKPAYRPASAEEMAQRLMPFEEVEPPSVSAPADQETSASTGPPALPPLDTVPLVRGETPGPLFRAVSDPEPTGATYWRSFSTQARGGRTGPPRALPIYGALAGAISIAGLLAWLVVRTPGRPEPPAQRTADRAARSSSPSTVPVPTAAPQPAAVAPPPIEPTALPAISPTAVAVVRPTARPPVAPAAAPAVRPEPVREASAAPTPRPASRRNDAEPALRRALDGWIASTNAADVSGHMRYYMPTVNRFYLTRNVSRSFVRAEKDRLFGRATRIDVRAGVPEIRTAGDGRTATMRFRKRYVIEGPRVSRRGEVEQELLWVRTSEGWRIVGERDASVIR